jgi:hypothetical protein
MWGGFTAVHCSKARQFMSALGHKQTYAVQKGMSALPPKADMCGATSDVRFGPIAGMREMKCAKQKDRLAAVSPKSDQVC